MRRKLKVSLKPQPALTATRVSVSTERMVYVLVASRTIKYPYGRSRIAYIGTTEKGIQRVAQSVAHRAGRILGLHGVRSFQARIVSCRRRQNVSTWKKLEAALLLKFRKEFGTVPRFNQKGAKMSESDEFDYFKEARIREIIGQLSED
jgi:hypothetical protein